MDALTTEQRAANKAARLKHGADPNDGVTVRILIEGSCMAKGNYGSAVVVSKAKAEAAIANGHAELAE